MITDDGILTHIRLISACSELGHLVYSMVSDPISGQASLSGITKKLLFRQIISNSSVSGNEDSDSTSFTAFNTSSKSLKRRVMENEEFSTIQKLSLAYELPINCNIRIRENFNEKSFLSKEQQQNYYHFAAICFNQCLNKLQSLNNAIQLVFKVNCIIIDSKFRTLMIWL